MTVYSFSESLWVTKRLETFNLWKMTCRFNGNFVVWFATSDLAYRLQLNSLSLLNCVCVAWSKRKQSTTTSYPVYTRGDFTEKVHWQKGTHTINSSLCLKSHAWIKWSTVCARHLKMHSVEWNVLCNIFCFKFHWSLITWAQLSTPKILKKPCRHDVHAIWCYFILW